MPSVPNISSNKVWLLTITYRIGDKLRQYDVFITHELDALAISSRAGVWNAANLITISSVIATS